MTDATRPNLPLPGIVFVAVMLVTGVVLALVFKAHPALIEAIPGLMWLLGVALVFDIGVNVLAMQGRVEGALPMTWRAGGFIAGGLVHVATTALLG
ncbi:MAG: hypothetical protein Q8O26_15500 [Phreatobacter sp.]|uniref:hypothetical protein n=1 Tax=Phreatobacter sp. TaxID=1966341 RepID=UPI0027373A79|nr:hypothetical protein [Phreatobacter sp.]MDP2803278.1 hypothetical protein [Phreatobacter sp.]